MKGRKRGSFLPLTFFMLFVCIAGHATDDSDDGEEGDALGKFGSGTKHATVLKPDWVLNKPGDAQNFASSSSKIVHFL